MNAPPSDDVLEITFTPILAWFLIIFGGLFLALGVLFTTPLVARQNVPLGVGISLAAIAVIAGGWYWRNHLRVLLRLTPDELQFPTGRYKTVRWVDVERVGVTKLLIQEGQCVGIQLREEVAQAMGLAPPGELFRQGDYHILLNELNYAFAAEGLAAEMNRRVGLAMAQQRGHKQETPSAVEEPSRTGVGDLGPVERAFPPSRRGLMRSLAGGGAALAGGAGSILMPFVRTPKPGEEGAIYALFFTLGGLLAVGGLSFIAVAYFRPRTSVIVHRDGFRLLRGKSETDCRWEDISTLRTRTETETTHPYTIHLIERKGGETLEIDPNTVRDTEVLMGMIEIVVCRLHGPRLVERIRSGEVVSHGPLVLAPDGLQIGRDTFPWRELCSLDVDSGTDTVILDLTTHSRETGIMAASVPNYCVVADVVEALHAEAHQHGPNFWNSGQPPLCS
jgi:hypothetical protein